MIFPHICRYSGNKEEMDAMELLNFLKTEEYMPLITKEKCLSHIEAFEPSQMKESGKISLIGTRFSSKLKLYIIYLCFLSILIRNNVYCNIP